MFTNKSKFKSVKRHYYLFCPQGRVPRFISSDIPIRETRRCIEINGKVTFNDIKKYLDQLRWEYTTEFYLTLNPKVREFIQS